MQFCLILNDIYHDYYISIIRYFYYSCDSDLFMHIMQSF